MTLEQVTYIRKERPPTLKQYLVRKAVALAASQAKGKIGVGKTTVGVPIPNSAVAIKEALPNLSDTDAIAREHPEWVKEWEEKYGQRRAKTTSA